MLDDLDTRFDDPLYRKPILRPRGVESDRSQLRKKREREKLLALNCRNGFRLVAAVMTIVGLLAAEKLDLLAVTRGVRVGALLFTLWLVLCVVIAIALETIVWHRLRKRDDTAIEEFRRISPATDPAPADYYEAARFALGFALRAPSRKLRVQDRMAFFGSCGAAPFGYEVVVRAAEYLRLRLLETELDDVIHDVHVARRDVGSVVTAVAEGLHRAVRRVAIGRAAVDSARSLPDAEAPDLRRQDMTPRINRERIEAAELLTKVHCTIERQMLPVKLVGRLIPVVVALGLVQWGWIAGSAVLSLVVVFVAMLVPAYCGFRFASYLARRHRRRALSERVPMGTDTFVAALSCPPTDRAIVVVLRSLFGTVRGLPAEVIYPADTHETLLYPLRYSALMPFPPGAVVAAAKRRDGCISYDDAERLVYSSLEIEELIVRVLGSSATASCEIDREQVEVDDPAARPAHSN